ncbi:MAG TPA: Gfo/Idh/MocA family oxidoreductase [Humibacter sp.]|nr:Gfo/Idh/MocA family oxidoreductase [Humibacter sp.]
MNGFATIGDASRPVRFIQVGAGGMGRAWTHALRASPDAELAGLVDLDPAVARDAARGVGMPELPIARSITELIGEVDADAVLNVTVPVAHHAVTTEALLLGLPVLSEKPAAPTVALAMSLAATARMTGRLLMISQSRRYYRQLDAFKASFASLGQVGMLTNDFFKAPHFGGFREDMPYPLLVDMAIHPFDVARYLLDKEPVSVYCDSFNPAWSWYNGDAAATALFEFTGGVRFRYTGSWCSPGEETSWNGTWRASGATGAALWDGESAPALDTPEAGPAAPAALEVSGEQPEEIGGALAEFVHALRTGEEPSGEAARNIGSLVMVEAAVQSAMEGRQVQIADVLATAFDAALAAEVRPEVREALQAFGSASGWRVTASI